MYLTRSAFLERSEEILGNRREGGRR